MSESTTKRVAAFVARQGLDAEIVSTPGGVPTVERAAQALGVEVDQIIKTLVFLGPAAELVIAIACGTNKVDRRKLASVLGLSKVTIASPADVLARTGYPTGGVAPLDLPAEALVAVDQRVTEQAVLYGGSGTDLHMLRVRSADVVRLNDARVAPIVREPGD